MKPEHHLRPPRTAKRASLRSHLRMTGLKLQAWRGNTIGGTEIDGQARRYNNHAPIFPDRNSGETVRMKSGFFAAACGLLLAAPASAQGVKIGILNDQSGVYANYGGKYSVEAARMAIEDFGGEVLGHKVELITADHQNKPDLAVSIARRWYDADGVDMVTELTTSTVALAVQELSNEKK